MAHSGVTIKINVKDLKAFRIAYTALRDIVNAEPDESDADFRDRRYGIGREIAEDAIAEIDGIGLVPNPPEKLPAECPPGFRVPEKKP
jgi:hypothetical protein